MTLRPHSAESNKLHLAVIHTSVPFLSSTSLRHPPPRPPLHAPAPSQPLLASSNLDARSSEAVHPPPPPLHPLRLPRGLSPRDPPLPLPRARVHAPLRSSQPGPRLREPPPRRRVLPALRASHPRRVLGHLTGKHRSSPPVDHLAHPHHDPHPIRNLLLRSPPHFRLELRDFHTAYKHDVRTCRARPPGRLAPQPEGELPLRPRRRAWEGLACRRRQRGRW